MKYRIMSSHCGDAPEKAEEFETDSDQKALKRINYLRNKKEYSWDTLWLYRIDQEEKTTLLENV